MRPGSTRLAYASCSATARSSSNATTRAGSTAARAGPRRRSAKALPRLGRAPRAQSAAAIGRLPGGCTRPSSSSADAVPTRTPSLPTSSRPGSSSCAPRRRSGPSLSRSPRNVVQAPGAGVQARTARSTWRAGCVQSTRASSTVSFGAMDLDVVDLGGGPVVLLDQGADLAAGLGPGLDLGGVSTQEPGGGAHGSSLVGKCLGWRYVGPSAGCGPGPLISPGRGGPSSPLTSSGACGRTPRSGRWPPGPGPTCRGTSPAAPGPARCARPPRSRTAPPRSPPAPARRPPA